MRIRTIRGRQWLWMSLAFILVGALHFSAAPGLNASATIPVDVSTPLLINGEFECSAGTSIVDALQGGLMQIPTGWHLNILDGTPWLQSTRVQFNGHCGSGGHIERIGGEDSLAIFAHDLEWTAQPGKPFDVAIHQQVNAQPGTAYSLSAWMLSLCGGSTMPNDCPDGYYMAKMIGIDPTGGTDPRAASVIWSESRTNFVENGARVGWVNLQVSALAESETITIFGRVHSPFQWHGNHAFIDAFSLVEAPDARFESTSGRVDSVDTELNWQGTMSSRVRTTPGSTHALFFDVETRLAGQGDWSPWLAETSLKSALFQVDDPDVTHEFRIRARAIQPPDGPAGVWPNHRYIGVWSEPIQILFGPAPDYHFHLYLPDLARR